MRLPTRTEEWAQHHLDKQLMEAGHIADKLKECRSYDRETNLRGRLAVAERNAYLLKEELRWQHRQITNNPEKARSLAELIKQKLGIL